VLPDRRAYFLALAPVGISAVQLFVRFLTLDMNVMMLADMICVALISLGFSRLITRDILFLLTGVSIAQTLLTAGIYYPNPLYLIHHIVLYILFPFLLAQSYARYDLSVFVKMGILAALSLAAMNIIVMPLELMLRGGIANLYKLQFSGRAYELNAVLLLSMTLAAIGVRRANGPLSLALLITSSVSFSRGAVAVAAAVLTLNWRRHFRLLFSYKGMFLAVFLALATYNFLSSQTYEAMNVYWTARLNFAYGASMSSNMDNFLYGFGRESIWSIGLREIAERPFLGSGIATTSFYISEVTDGRYSYSGYHNLTITILAERGIFVGALFLMLVLFILARLVLGRNWQSLTYFGGFLIFAHVTGNEFVLHSLNVRNANVLFFLFLLYVRLPHMKLS